MGGTSSQTCPPPNPTRHAPADFPHRNPELPPHTRNWNHKRDSSLFQPHPRASKKNSRRFPGRDVSFNKNIPGSQAGPDRRRDSPRSALPLPCLALRVIWIWSGASVDCPSVQPQPGEPSQSLSTPLSSTLLAARFLLSSLPSHCLQLRYTESTHIVIEARSLWFVDRGPEPPPVSPHDGPRSAAAPSPSYCVPLFPLAYLTVGSLLYFYSAPALPIYLISFLPSSDGLGSRRSHHSLPSFSRCPPHCLLPAVVILAAASLGEHLHCALIPPPAAALPCALVQAYHRRLRRFVASLCCLRQLLHTWSASLTQDA